MSCRAALTMFVFGWFLAGVFVGMLIEGGWR